MMFDIRDEKVSRLEAQLCQHKEYLERIEGEIRRAQELALAARYFLEALKAFEPSDDREEAVVG